MGMNWIELYPNANWACVMYDARPKNFFSPITTAVFMGFDIAERYAVDCNNMYGRSDVYYRVEPIWRI